MKVHFVEKKRNFIDNAHHSSKLAHQIRENSLTHLTYDPMMPQRLRTYRCLPLVLLLFTLSCSQETDEFDIAVEGFINEKGEISGTSPTLSFEAVDDVFSISGLAASSKLNVLANDSIPTTGIEDYQIVALSSADNAEVNINEDKTITYTPHAEAASKADSQGMLTDDFTYTLEITKNGSIEQKQATVTVNASFDTTGTDSYDAMGELLAFPGAKGFGKNTTGGRGGKVIHVTNLNDSGEGSLREALDTEGSRIIVFDVGGNININTPTLPLGSSNYDLNKARENITIAGETAPYPGITITGGYLDIYTSNVIIRYISFRPNPNQASTGFSARIRNWGKGGYVQSNIVIDHCSMSHSRNMNFAIGGQSETENVNNITFSNNLLGKPYGLDDGNGGLNHQYNFLRGDWVYDLSIVENYFAPSEYRNPQIGYGKGSETVEVINNISYGSQATLDISWGNIVDGIANIYKPFENGFRWNVISYFKFPDEEYGKTETPTIHISENIILPPFRSGISEFNSGVIKNNQPNRMLTNSKINSWYTNKEAIENAVLTDVGNSLYRDELDSQLINEYLNNTGDFSIAEIPFKGYTERDQSYDTDKDGMSDIWEIVTFGNISAKPNDDHNQNGYTNIEEFLYSIVM